MPERRGSVGCRACSLAVEQPLDLAAERDQLAERVRFDAQPRGPRVERGVDGAPVGDVDGEPAARGIELDSAGEHVGRDVAEGHRLDARVAQARASEHAPRGHVDRHVGLAVGRGDHAAALDRPGAERDRAVPAGGRVAVLVPEEHAEVGAVVVRAGRGSSRTCRRGRAARGRGAGGRSRRPGPVAARSRRSATVAPGISGAPSSTILNGSPAVW